MHFGRRRKWAVVVDPLGKPHVTLWLEVAKDGGTFTVLRQARDVLDALQFRITVARPWSARAWRTRDLL